MNNYLGFTLNGKYFVSKVPQPDEEQYTMVGPFPTSFRARLWVVERMNQGDRLVESWGRGGIFKKHDDRLIPILGIENVTLDPEKHKHFRWHTVDDEQPTFESTLQAQRITNLAEDMDRDG
jgi:hypothetical protein